MALNAKGWKQRRKEGFSKSPHLLREMNENEVPLDERRFGTLERPYSLNPLHSPYQNKITNEKNSNIYFILNHNCLKFSSRESC